jgi:hypothetical protein
MDQLQDTCVSQVDPDGDARRQIRRIAILRASSFAVVSRKMVAVAILPRDRRSMYPPNIDISGLLVSNSRMESPR